MAEATSPSADVPLTLEQKKEAARARARAARAAQQAGGGDAVVGLSEGAATYIRRVAGERGQEPGVRLRILAGGCSGLEYKLDLLDPSQPPTPDERVMDVRGVRLVMDLKSAIHVTGSEIDYEDGLLRRGFRIKNPNATTTCSCGDSFSA